MFMNFRTNFTTECFPKSFSYTSCTLINPRWRSSVSQGEDFEGSVWEVEGLAEHWVLEASLKQGHLRSDLGLFSKAAICDESPKLYTSKKSRLVNGKEIAPTFIFMQMVPAE